MIKLSGLTVKLKDCDVTADKFFKICLILRHLNKLKDKYNKEEIDELYFYLDSILEEKSRKDNIMIDIGLYDKIIDLYNYFIKGE